MPEITTLPDLNHAEDSKVATSSEPVSKRDVTVDGPEKASSEPAAEGKGFMNERTNGPNDLSSEVPQIKALRFLDQFLALWIILAMAVGIVLGAFVPSTHDVLNKVQFANVSLPIAIGLLVMMWPILCRVSYSSLTKLLTTRSVWYHLLLSFVINWIVAPFVMLGLAWAFLPDKEHPRQGLILVGLARCIAMVLVWTDIAQGDADYCALLVAFNSILQIVLYAPMGTFFINVIQPSSDMDVESYRNGMESNMPQSTTHDIDIHYSTVATSVAVFLGIPLGAAILTRFIFIFVLKQKNFFNKVFLPLIGPLSLIGLLFTTLIIFAAQGNKVVHSIVLVVRVAAPLVVYFLIMFFLTLLLCRYLKISYRLTVSQSFTAASNNFELAIAVAIASYGADSDQALAATVGPLIEVPVLLGLAYLLVWYRKRTHWDLSAVAPPKGSSVLHPSAKDDNPTGKDVESGDIEKAVPEGENTVEKSAS